MSGGVEHVHEGRLIRVVRGGAREGGVAGVGLGVVGGVVWRGRLGGWKECAREE